MGKHDIFMAKRKGMFTFTEGMIRKTFSIRLRSANGLGFTPNPWLPINFK
jgi:hypothetical protein